MGRRLSAHEKGPPVLARAFLSSGQPLDRATPASNSRIGRRRGWVEPTHSRRAASRDLGVVSSPPMRRFLRWTSNFAAAVSALLFVTTCVLWVRSYQVADQFAWSDPRHLVGFNSDRGTFWLYSGSRMWPSNDPDGFIHRWADPRWHHCHQLTDLTAPMMVRSNPWHGAAVSRRLMSLRGSVSSSRCCWRSASHCVQSRGQSAEAFKEGGCGKCNAAGASVLVVATISAPLLTVALNAGPCQRERRHHDASSPGCVQPCGRGFPFVTRSQKPSPRPTANVNRPARLPPDAFFSASPEPPGAVVSPLRGSRARRKILAVE